MMSTAVTIGIITYRRPESLNRLLRAVAAQQYEAGYEPQVTVLVVDNDAARSAEATCTEAKAALGLNIVYVTEAQQGIPLARNRLLDTLPDKTDFVAWIDDDESPAPDWLATLLLVQEDTEADIVMGAIQADLPAKAPSWVKAGGFFNRRRFVDRAFLTEGATNNCLMKVDTLRQSGLRFDETLRFNGGSDTLFFRQAARKNFSMVWSAASLVYDHVPLERCSLRWLAKRNYRAGNTLALCDLKMDGAKGWFLRFGRAVGKFVQGVFNIPLALLGAHEFTRGVLIFARAFGMFSGLVGVRYQEHRPPQS